MGAIIIVLIVVLIITSLLEYFVFDYSPLSVLFHASIKSGVFIATLAFLMWRDEKKNESTFEEWRLREIKKAASLWDEDDD